MSYELAKKIREMTPYAPIQGEYPVRLDANESYIDLNDPAPLSDPQLEAGKTLLREKICKALSQVALNRYPDPLCQGPCRAFARLYGLREDQITAGNGSDELIALIMGCLLEKGEKALSLTPDFSMYAFYAQLYEKQVFSLEKEANFSLDMEKVVEKARAEGMKAIVFSNPCNPTGAIFTREQVETLCRSLPSCLIVADEAYMEFCQDSEGYTVLPLVGEYDNLIVLKTCSKAVGLAGLRLGFAVAGEKITRALQAAKSPYNVNSLSQAVAQTVLEEGEFLRRCAKALIQGCRELENGLRELALSHPSLGEIYATNTNFVFFKPEQAALVWEDLMAKGVAIRCMGDRLRVCTGSPEENRRFLQALDEVLSAREGA